MLRDYGEIKSAAKYGRLSQEDRDKKNFSESDSISSQRDLINQFCKEKGIKSQFEFFDDGITGLTFERENWQLLIKEIESGNVDCVITKDLSRLGRDHSETGYYIEKYFPEKKIRYISINDNWDSKYDSLDMLLWKLAYNDVYCADISKKIISSLNTKKRLGQYVGSFAPYGYKKDPKDKHRLIIDVETAPIVKEIFEMAYIGMGTCAIANRLNQEKRITPGKYCGRHRKKNQKTWEEVGDIWTTSHVRRILSNEVYIGNIVQSKIKKASYKSKKLIRNNEDNWIRVEGTHEPLVEKEVFELIQSRLKESSKKYTRLPGENCLLSKKLFCKDCGHRISVSWKSSKKHERGKCGMCNYYKKYSKYNVCTPHYIDYDEFEIQILDYIRNELQIVLSQLNTPKIIRENFKNLTSKVDEWQNKVNKIEEQIYKEESMLVKIYEDKLNEVITESMYKTLSERKSKELEAIKEELIKAKGELSFANRQLESNDENIKKVKVLIDKFLKSDYITQDILNLIIDRIDVGENDIIDVKLTIKSLV